MATVKALIGLAFAGCVGLLFLVLGCALPMYNSWYPLFVVIFYILVPVPLTLAGRYQERASTGSAASCQDFALFLTAANAPAIHWGACGFTLAGNVVCFLTIAAYFYIHQDEDNTYGVF
uniref:Leptin receptor gene-related protein n=1 Tax=Trichuris muris TaxID=70415 RepID=A0A5S6Q6M7_TRIMR